MNGTSRALPAPGTGSFTIGGVNVIDGLGTAAYRADVAVERGIIRQVGDLSLREPDVDGRGLTLAPGFIDMHAHSDLAAFGPLGHRAKLSQGVTTEVIGQDGLGYAPTSVGMRGALADQIAGWNRSPEGSTPGWETVEQYLAAMRGRLWTNVATLVPQGNLRWMVIGTDSRPAGVAELSAMQELLAEALQHGSFGMSSGLNYPPGCFADQAELTALCEVVAQHGGFYAPHIRSYGVGALEAYAEVIEIARDSGCALHLTHANMMFPLNRGRSRELLALVDNALDDGIDITLDSYPYTAGSTTLVSLLPSAIGRGSVAEIRAALADPVTRIRVRELLEIDGSDGAHGVPIDWSTVVISSVGTPERRDAVGISIADLAGRQRCDAFEVFVDLLDADRCATTIVQHVGDEQNVRTTLRHRRHTVGSDGILVGDHPHPRAWGTFPRVLGHYARDLQLFTLEEAVEHMTSRPARRLGLGDRGVIAPGMAADLVLFDAATVADRSSYENPTQASVGIVGVWVNGMLAVDCGRTTTERAGVCLRRGPIDLPPLENAGAITQL